MEQTFAYKVVVDLIHLQVPADGWADAVVFFNDIMGRAEPDYMCALVRRDRPWSIEMFFITQRAALRFDGVMRNAKSFTAFLGETDETE